ncbi:MAG: ABC transporter substrate-binding protein [Actinomycetota bacterium]
MSRSPRPTAVLLIAALAIAACGGSDDGAADAEVASTATGSSTTAETDEVEESTSSSSSGADAADAAGDADEPGAGGPDDPAEEGGTATDDDAATESEPEPDAEPFPVTIEHQFGSTTIEERPTRIVALGNGGEDVLISLGIMPTALAQTFAAQDFVVWPWAQEEYDALLAETGAPEPELITFAGGVPFEQIADLEPDIILAVNSFIEEPDYELLSAIAPTVFRPDGYRFFGVPLREWVEIIATAVGVPERAQGVLDDLDAQFAAAREANPQFEGSTATMAFYSAQGNLVSYPPDDFRHQFIRDLGFEVSDELDALAGDERFVTISVELIDTIDADVVVWLPGSGIDITATRDLPVREALLTAAQRRSEVVADSLVSNALTNYSPLAVEFALEQLVDELALAADGDPETIAASASVLYEDGDFESTPPQAEALEFFKIVFDSTFSIEEKEPYVEDFDELLPVFEEFAALAEGLGGITSEIVGATTAGDTVTFVYSAVAGGAPVLDGLTSRITLVDGTWIVSRDDLCAAVAAGGIECP